MKKRYFYPLIISLLIPSCGDLKVDPTYNENPDIARKTRAGRFFDDPITFFDKKDSKEKKEEKQNDNSLWIASVEVIGSLFPISVIDANSGIIVTEWYQSGDNDDQRIKINALIKGKEIKEENLNISIFNQTKDKKGLWNDKKVDNTIAINLIKEKIIQKAKQALDIQNDQTNS